jgi:hypothetical protein
LGTALPPGVEPFLRRIDLMTEDLVGRCRLTLSDPR